MLFDKCDIYICVFIGCSYFELPPLENKVHIYIKFNKTNLFLFFKFHKFNT